MSLVANLAISNISGVALTVFQLFVFFLLLVTAFPVKQAVSRAVNVTITESFNITFQVNRAECISSILDELRRFSWSF